MLQLDLRTGDKAGKYFRLQRAANQLNPRHPIRLWVETVLPELFQVEGMTPREKEARDAMCRIIEHTMLTPMLNLSGLQERMEKIEKIAVEFLRKPG